MSKARRDIQEQLQKDEVAETLQKIGANIRDNRNLLITVFIVVVLTVLLGSGLRNRREGRLADSNAKMNNILAEYQALNSATDPAAADASLKRIVTAADQLAAAYPDSRLGHEALYIKGNAYYNTNNFAKAQDAFNEYLKKAQDNGEMARGEIALGYAYENDAFMSPEKQQVDKINAALNCYIRAANYAQNKAPYLYYYALLAQARIHELKPGEEAKAVTIYKQILSERPVPVAPNQQTAKDAQQDSLLKMLRGQVEQAENQMSFQATARLRLDRLEAKTESPETVSTQVKTAAPPAAAAAPKK